MCQPELSHRFTHSMFAHMIRLNECVCVQTAPSEPAIIVTERQQFWVLVPLSVFQESSDVKHFPVDSKYCWLYVFCKLEQINCGASGNLQTEKGNPVGSDDITKVFSTTARHLNCVSRNWRSNYATRCAMNFIVCFHVLILNLKCRSVASSCTIAMK